VGVCFCYVEYKTSRRLVTILFYFKAFGAVLGYLYVARWNPGGRVTINFDKSTYSEDEKTLDSLVGKYRSNTLIVLPLIGYLTADFIKGRMQGQTHIGSIEV
jgi:hypothetical protein